MHLYWFFSCVNMPGGHGWHGSVYAPGGAALHSATESQGCPANSPCGQPSYSSWSARLDSL